MALFEVETTSHIMIACVDDESGARSFASRITPRRRSSASHRRPRDAWVISKTSSA